MGDIGEKQWEVILVPVEEPGHEPIHEPAAPSEPYREREPEKVPA